MWLVGRESPGEPVGQHAAVRSSEGPGRGQGPNERTRPRDEHPVDEEGSGEQAAFDPGEAQRGPDGRPGTHRVGHHRLLAARRRNQCAPVTSRHDEPWMGDDPPGGVPALQPAPIVLGVDDPDA